ncbi:MAG: hypothetical protein ACRBBU_14825 [Pseudooceanicola sp.]
MTPVAQTAPRAADLIPDCGQCAALCCLSLAFDDGPDFALDKPAGTPCPNLGRHDCTIHDALSTSGYSGCVRYSCLGAGQRVTQSLFAGQSWRDDPALTAPMMAAFADLRAVHKRLDLLAAAMTLPLSDSHKTLCLQLQQALWRDDMTQTTFAGFADSPLAMDVDGFIADLRSYLTPPPETTDRS